MTGSEASSAAVPWVLDGHNDALLRIHLEDAGDPAPFLEGRGRGHLDLPRIERSSFRAGFFAVFVPHPDEATLSPEVMTGKRLPRRVAHEHASPAAGRMVDVWRRLVEAGAGRLLAVETAADLEAARRGEAVGTILHFEGAEPIATDLRDFESWVARGLRSLGLVWSRANDFGTGVPFLHPGSPDVGEGLTAAGRDLVAACNNAGVLVDLAHLNAAGFWDVQRLSSAPLVVSHSAVHSLAPSARNLTDDQIAAVADSEGLVGLTFHCRDLARDGRIDTGVTLDALVDHLFGLIERAGVEHVALGSDFDGAVVPEAIGDVTGLDALLRRLGERGCGADELEAIAHRNWMRVLRTTWH